MVGGLGLSLGLGLDLLVVGEDGAFGFVVICGRREVWFLDPVVVVGVRACCCCGVLIVDDAASTEPPHETKMSNSPSWGISGYIDRSKASFISVDSSSGVDVVAGGDAWWGLWSGCSRGFFRETNTSIGE